MQRTSPAARQLQPALTAILAVFLLIFAVRTWHWPLVGDAPLMHYVVFLIHHGMLPYRDIVDPNLPGTYFLQSLVMRFAGPDALPWRLFDLSLLVTTGLAMLVITGRKQWFAAFFAAVLFALIHGRDGLVDTGQRDLTLTALILIAYAFCFSALRSNQSTRRYLLIALAGLTLGCATTIKPTGLFFFVALALPFLTQPRRRSTLTILLASYTTPLLVMTAALAHWHLLGACTDSLTHLVPALSAIGHRSLAHLLLHTFSGVLLPVVLLWLPLAWRKRNTWPVERIALFAGIAAGLLSFYAQSKGYPYHRYPSEALILLLIACDFTETLHDSTPAHPWPRYLATAGLLVGVLLVGGGSLRHALWQDAGNQEFATLLTADLTHLGGQSLSGHVQCLDNTDSCIPTLYQLRLVQSTGFLYDCYVLAPNLSPATLTRYRARFQQSLQQNPPQVFIVTSDECTPTPSHYHYEKLARWPLLTQDLSANYTLYAERLPPHAIRWGSSPTPPVGYRLYVRKSEPTITGP